MRLMLPDREILVRTIRIPTAHGSVLALLLSPRTAQGNATGVLCCMAADFVGLPPAYSFVADSEPFYAETVRYFDSLRAAGVPAKLDVYHTNMHAFDMMRPRDAQSVAAAEAFERQFADARARYFAPQENTV